MFGAGAKRDVDAVDRDVSTKQSLMNRELKDENSLLKQSLMNRELKDENSLLKQRMRELEITLKEAQLNEEKGVLARKEAELDVRAGALRLREVLARVINLRIKTHEKNRQFKGFMLWVQEIEIKREVRGLASRLAEKMDQEIATGGATISIAWMIKSRVDTMRAMGSFWGFLRWYDGFEARKSQSGP